MAIELVILVIGVVMLIAEIVKVSSNPLASIAISFGSPPVSVIIFSLGPFIAGLGLTIFLIGLAVRKKQQVDGVTDR